MKTLACVPVLFVAVASFGLGGCGSSSSSDTFGVEPDYASVQQRFTNPTGTISERNLGSVFSRYSEQKSAQSLGTVGSTTSATTEASAGDNTTTHSKALHILSGSSGITSSCAALGKGDTSGSCTCPDGGSFTYDFSGMQTIQQSTGPVDASLKIRFDGCHSKDIGIDGREFVRVHTDRGGTTLDLKSLTLLVIADFSVSKGTETHQIDLAASLRNGEFELALAVDDGWITVRATSSFSSDGRFVVRDRNGTWTCDVRDGSGTCNGPNGTTSSF